MDYLEFKAKTVEEAITQACLKYGVTSERLDYTVVDEGKARFFGLFGSREAVIKARVKEEKKNPAAETIKKDAQLSKNFDSKNVDKKSGKKVANANRAAEKKSDTSGKSSGKAEGSSSGKAEGKSAGKGNSGKNISQNTESEANGKDGLKPVSDVDGKTNAVPAVSKEAQAGEKVVDGYKKSGKGEKAGKYEKKGGRSGKSERKNDRQGGRGDKAGRQSRSRYEENADGIDLPEKKASDGAEDAFANESQAAINQNFNGKAGRYAGDIVTADEIEKRAAAAAAKAMEEGVTYPEEMQGEDRPSRRDRRDRRDRRGRRNDRQGRGRKYGEENAEYAGSEKPHKQSQPKPARIVTPKSDEEVAEMKEAAKSFLDNVFRCMDVNVDITMDYDPIEGCLNCIFAGDEMGILIGKRGQTLDSLQYLTSLVVNKNKNDYTRVKLDTEDYRARREDTLENLSRNIAYKVRRTGRSVALEPMNPYERRIIHSSLQGNRFVETYSEGEEPYRHVVVAPKRK